MRATLTKMLTALALAGAPLMIAGCGSSGSNDQGVAFTNLGFFQEGDDGLVGLTGALLRLGSADDTTGEMFNIRVGLQNNLLGQAIRVHRVHFTYFIPGASIQPPDTNAAGGFPLLLAAGENDSTLPPGLVGGGAGGSGDNPTANVYFSELLVVPSQIMQWLNFNRMNLPETPFDMEVTVWATGVTTAGDVIESNTQTLMMRVLSDVSIPGSESGGDDEEEGDAASEDISTEETGGGTL